MQSLQGLLTVVWYSSTLLVEHFRECGEIGDSERLDFLCTVGHVRRVRRTGAFVVAEKYMMRVLLTNFKSMLESEGCSCVDGAQYRLVEIRRDWRNEEAGCTDDMI